MNIASSAAAALAWLALAGCAQQAPEVDQLAQSGMIGLSRQTIRACMGAPFRRVTIGATEIWTYPNGAAGVEGLFLASGVNGMASWFGPRRSCRVNVVMTHAVVSQVTYAALDGGPLALGESCQIAVRNCLGP